MNSDHDAAGACVGSIEYGVHVVCRSAAGSVDACVTVEQSSLGQNISTIVSTRDTSDTYGIEQLDVSTRIAGGPAPCAPAPRTHQHHADSTCTPL